MLLDTVQKEIVGPSDHTENLKQNISTNLARHRQHLQHVHELLNTAKSHNDHTEHLLMNIRTNLEEHRVSDSVELNCCLGVGSDACLFIHMRFSVQKWLNVRSVECNGTQMFQQTLRHNVSSLNQSVVEHLDEAQDSLADALFIAEGMGNLTVVRPDISLLHSVT